MGLIKDAVRAYVIRGSDVPTALVLAVEKAAVDANQAVSEGTPPERALREAGFSARAAARIAERVARDVVEQQFASRSMTERVIRTVVSFALESGVAEIPTAECLHQHLPPDREPTDEDWDRAWAECEKE